SAVSTLPVRARDAPGARAEAARRSLPDGSAAAGPGVDRVRVGRMARLSGRPRPRARGGRVSRAPALSVVVGLISGRKNDLARCLAALGGQREFPSLEVIVPYDDPCADVATLAAEYPEVKFLHASALDTWKARAGVSREHHDTLRTLGLQAAT